MKNIFKKLICAALIFNPLSMKSAAMESWVGSVKGIISRSETLQKLAILNGIGCVAYMGYKTYRAATKKMTFIKQDADAQEVKNHLAKKIEKKKIKINSNLNGHNFWSGYLWSSLMMLPTAKLIGWAKGDLIKAKPHDVDFVSLKLPHIATYAITKGIEKSIKYIRRKKNNALDYSQLSTMTFKPEVPTINLKEIEDENNKCAICLDELRTEQHTLTQDEKHNQREIIAPCGTKNEKRELLHIFHKECAMQWLEKSTSCPTCKQTCKLNPKAYSPDNDLMKLNDLKDQLDSKKSDLNGSELYFYMGGWMAQLALTIAMVKIYRITK